MKKLILILLFVPLFSFGQKIPDELVNEATTKWTFHFEGNPIDGQYRTAFRINNEFDDEIVFILKVKSKAETIKIVNGTGESKNNRDDVYIDIRSSIPTNEVDEILMYFNDEKKYYKVNFKTYGENGFIWWNAISNDNLEFISRFNFINKLKIKNEVFFRFKYNDREDVNISFSLNDSSNTINKVVDLSNFNIVENDDSVMESLVGMFSLGAAFNKMQEKEDILKLNIKREDLLKKLNGYLFETFGDYVMTFIRFEYKGNLILNVLDYNDKLLKRIDLNLFKEEPETPIQAINNENEIYLTNKYWVATDDNFITDNPSLMDGKMIVEVKEGDIVRLFSSSVKNEYYQYISYKQNFYKGYVHKVFYEPRE